MLLSYIPDGLDIPLSSTVRSVRHTFLLLLSGARGGGESSGMVEILIVSESGWGLPGPLVKLVVVTPSRSEDTPSSSAS